MNMQLLTPFFAASLNSFIGILLPKWSRTSLPAHVELADKCLPIGFVRKLAFCRISVAFFVKARDCLQESISYPVLTGSFSHDATHSARHTGLQYWRLHHLTFWTTVPFAQLMGIDLVLTGIIFLSRGD